jgi:hypothetical protein
MLVMAPREAWEEASIVLIALCTWLAHQSHGILAEQGEMAGTSSTETGMVAMAVTEAKVVVYF